MFRLMWSNISRRRNQSLLTITITALTILTFVVVYGVFSTMSQGIELSRQRLGADAIIVPQSADADGYELLFTANPENIYMPASMLDTIAALDGVAAATPQFYGQTLDGGCCDFGEEMRIIGIDQDTDFILEPYFNLQEFDRLGDDELILGGNFTDYVGFTYNVVGQPFKAVGELYPTGTGMDDTMFMNIDTARRLCIEGQDVAPEVFGVWKDKDPYEHISVIMVKLEENADPHLFAWNINMESDLDVQCVLAADTISSLQLQLEATMKILFMLWAALFVVAVLSLVGRFNALAKDRKKEIGLLRAIGMQKSAVFGLIIGEASIMAVIGGLIGSVCGCALMQPMIDMTKEAFNMATSGWGIGQAVLCGLAGLLLAVLLGFISALWPAVKSASLEPQTAITQGEMN